ncbi:MAG: zinc-dependent alcohol dehydrogenase, partial [Rudaea sp.]
MKALRLHGVGDLRLEVEPTPEPKEGETLVQVTAVGICGSDLHWFDEGAIGDARLTRPLVLGHEFAGVLENGERVAVDPAIPCGHCEMCREGNPNLCPQVRFAGHGLLDGALREFLPWPSNNLYLLPDSISDAEGALLEPLGVALHAIDLGHLRPGMTVGVFGCGPIGLLIVQVARASGASRIIATDRLDHRLEAAREFGATVAIRAREGQEDEEVWEAAGRRGVDVAFEAAGEDQAVDAAIAAARPGARV